MRWWFAGWLVIASINANAVEQYDRDKQLRVYMSAAALSLAPAQINALHAIRDDDKRYLAMTYYLRASASITSRWSWSNEQIKAYEQSNEYHAALAEIANIARRFAADNPPYVLFANTQVRSLEEQLSRWQSTRSINVAAAQLRKAAMIELARDSYSQLDNDKPSAEAIQHFRLFLTTWRASPPPTLAAPGLSLHGQGRAYDFQIRDKQGRTIAGTDSSTIRTVWDAQGWSEKLAVAVRAASDQFVGPLTTPREPWHYEYRAQ